MGQAIGKCTSGICEKRLVAPALNQSRDNGQTAPARKGTTGERPSVKRPASELWDCKTFLKDHTGPVSDAYRRVGELGEGAFGDVWLGRQRVNSGTADEREGRLVAIKRVRKPPHMNGTEMRTEDVEDFRTEVDLMKSLDHPSICRLFEVFEDKKNLYIVMEHIHGCELFDRVSDMGNFGEPDAADIIEQVASALTYCHKNGVVHRDIKPENIMVEDGINESPAGPRITVKVIDFGFGCRILEGIKLKPKLGSEVYQPPEVHKGDPCGEKQDLWALGCVIYVLLSGDSPFGGPGCKERIIEGVYTFEAENWASVSDDAKSLIKRLLTVSPEERISAADVLVHSWLKCNTGHAKYQASVKSGVAKPLQHLDALKSFHEKTVFQHVCAGVIARQLDESLLHKLHQAFSAMDEDEDGIVSMSEFKQACQELSPEGNRLFFSIDMDGSGYIDYTEFIAACIDRKIEEQEGVCWAAFQVFDKNGDGTVSFNELKEVMNSASMQSTFSKATLRQLWMQLTGQESDEDSSLTPALTPEGAVDFDHFMASLHGVRGPIRDPLLRAISTPLTRRSQGSSPSPTIGGSAPVTRQRSPHPSAGTMLPIPSAANAGAALPLPGVTSAASKGIKASTGASLPLPGVTSAANKGAKASTGANLPLPGVTDRSKQTNLPGLGGSPLLPTASRRKES